LLFHLWCIVHVFFLISIAEVLFSVCSDIQHLKYIISSADVHKVKSRKKDWSNEFHKWFYKSIYYEDNYRLHDFLR
jgi:hypothetical protein